MNNMLVVFIESRINQYYKQTVLDLDSKIIDCFNFFLTQCGPATAFYLKQTKSDPSTVILYYPHYRLGLQLMRETFGLR